MSRNVVSAVRGLTILRQRQFLWFKRLPNYFLYLFHYFSLNTSVGSFNENVDCIENSRIRCQMSGWLEKYWVITSRLKKHPLHRWRSIEMRWHWWQANCSRHRSREYIPYIRSIPPFWCGTTFLLFLVYPKGM